MKRILVRSLTYLPAVALLAAAVVALIGVPASGGAALAEGTYAAVLPLIRYDGTPTPVATPTQTPYSASAMLLVTPFKGINASTFNNSSFVLTNESLNGERLAQVRIDLRTAVFPDMVFDPYGAAGDTVAKDLTVDARVGLGFTGYSYESPHAGGFDVLVLNFTNFDPGDRFEFSVDVDPTSIQGSGAPGPGESGSVGGLEMVGTTVSAVFQNGATLANEVSRLPGAGESGAYVVVRDGAPERPQIAVPGVAAPAVVSQPAQTVRVSGPAGRPVTVLVIEGALFTAGLPGGGHDIDPFEANSALTVREYPAVVGLGGVVDVPVVLSRSLPEGGLNIITAVFDNHYGLPGPLAAPLVLQLQ